MKVSKSVFKQIEKKISASEYKKIKAKGTVKKKNFSFTAEKKVIGDAICITLYGKHLSYNAYNALHFRDKLKYKKAIKRAFLTIQRHQNPFFTVKLRYVVYNPKSRDDGANALTLKVIRDAIVLKGFFPDDSRKYIPDTPIEEEVISKEYKIEFFVQERLKC